MTMEQINLNWHTYTDHLKEMMQNLMQSNKSTDVTLVCEDKTSFKSHKFVLNACSPIFQSIIENFPVNENSAIYLKGVFGTEMKSILQFMYLGQTTLYQDRMTEFLNVAKSLELKEISKDLDFEEEETHQVQENVEDIQSNQRNTNEYESKLSSQSGIEEEINSETKISSYNNEIGHYLCHKCDKQFSSSGCLTRHIKRIHEEIRYPCNKCDKTFRESRNVTRHIQSVHNGVKYQCDLWDSVFSNFDSVQRHKKIH